MYGIWYSNTDKFQDDDLYYIKKIGLNEPFKNNQGTFLYNGSNNTASIGNQLDGNLDNTIEVIKSLKGEYSLIYITENHIVFCTDEFALRNLWFYFSPSKKIITIGSLPNFLKKQYNAAWQAEENKIYIIDKNTFKLNIIENREWNLIQNVNNYDKVFETFEQAVINRHEDNKTTYLLSSGTDSGLINCAASKLFKDFQTVIDVDGEDKEIIKERLKINKSKLITSPDTQPEKKEIFNNILPSEEFLDPNTDPLIYIIKNFVLKKEHKILISGNGGDIIYNDWQGQSNGIRRGKSNGYFPEDLKLVWPWINFHPRLILQQTRFDIITGFFGIEGRHPLLDQDLVQAWLNTSHNLKNKSYKDWMQVYMKEHNYPYSLTKCAWGQEGWKIPDWAK